MPLEPNSKWQRNLTLLNAMSFTRALMVIMPVFIPLMESYGLNMTQTMLLQSVFALVMLLTEVPSGYMADKLGRKITLVVGFFIAGIGFSQLVWANTFIEMIIFEATLGIALSLVSGSDLALAFESEKALGPKASKNGISHLLSWMSYGEAFSAFLAFVLIKFDLIWVIYAQAIVGWLPFALSIGLTEAPRTRSEDHQAAGVVQYIRKTFKSQPVIPVFTVLFVITMSFTYLVAWLNQALWLRGGVPIEMFGLIWGVFGLLVGTAARFSTLMPTHLFGLPHFSALAILLLVGYSLFATDVIALIILGGALISLFRGLIAPLIKQRLSEEISDDYRATVHSLVGSCFKISTLVLGPLMGTLVDHFNAHATALWLFALAMPSTIVLIWIGSRFNQQGQEISMTL